MKARAPDDRGTSQKARDIEDRWREGKGAGAYCGPLARIDPREYCFAPYGGRRVLLSWLVIVASKKKGLQVRFHLTNLLLFFVFAPILGVGGFCIWYGIMLVDDGFDAPGRNMTLIGIATLLANISIMGFDIRQRFRDMTANQPPRRAQVSFKVMPITGAVMLFVFVVGGISSISNGPFGIHVHNALVFSITYTIMMFLTLISYRNVR